MKRFSLCAGLAAAMLAGCASAPQTQDPGAAALGLTGTSAAAADQAAFADARAAAAEPADAARVDADAQPENIVVQAQVDAQDVHPGSEVVCKERLQHASNVIRRRCMTVDAWKRYEAAEAQRAQAILRSWQGSPYAGF
ncbi:MAG TPA: hypothetical protein VF339_15540 [Gammaproteobacteria bacterium]